MSYDEKMFIVDFIPLHPGHWHLTIQQFVELEIFAIEHSTFRNLAGSALIKRHGC